MEEEQLSLYQIREINEAKGWITVTFYAYDAWFKGRFYTIFEDTMTLGHQIGVNRLPFTFNDPAILDQELLASRDNWIQNNENFEQ